MKKTIQLPSYSRLLPIHARRRRTQIEGEEAERKWELKLDFYLRFAFLVPLIHCDAFFFIAVRLSECYSSAAEGKLCY